jgi:hypothetical protein
LYSDDNQRARYVHFTALLSDQLARKVQTAYLSYIPYIFLDFGSVIPTFGMLLSLKYYIYWTCGTYMMYLVQMMYTRRPNQGGENLPPPPPITMEQLMMMQTQLL